MPVNTDKICDFTPSDTQYAWLSWGPNFEVIRTTNGAKVAAWTFGAARRNSKTRVSCVTELPCNDGSGRVSQFVVGLECELAGGMICIFDIRGSKVLRAIQMPSKVCEFVISSILIMSGFEVISRVEECYLVR
jgi:hypothetical protein